MNTLWQHQNHFMAIFGAGVVAIVIGWFVFRVIDKLSLKTYETKAIVKGKEYRPAVTTYIPQNVSGTTYHTPQVTPENYLLILLIDKKTVYASIQKEKYESTRSGDNVTAIYRKRRITGTIEVIELRDR